MQEQVRLRAYIYAYIYMCQTYVCKYNRRLYVFVRDREKESERVREREWVCVYQVPRSLPLAYGKSLSCLCGSQALVLEGPLPYCWQRF
jgi:hypothetical protein